jgi:hypothetical protein
MKIKGPAFMLFAILALAIFAGAGEDLPLPDSIATITLVDDGSRDAPIHCNGTGEAYVKNSTRSCGETLWDKYGGDVLPQTLRRVNNWRNFIIFSGGTMRPKHASALGRALRLDNSGPH